MSLGALLEAKDACLTAGDITVIAWAAPVSGIGMPGSGVEPAWLAEPDGGSVLWPNEACAADVSCPFLFVHTPTRMGISGSDRWVEITGHYNDPAAQTCRSIPEFPDAPSDPVAYCAESFVLVRVDEPDAPADPAKSAWLQDPPTPLLLGAAVRIVVAELNVREAPSTSAKRLDTFRKDQVILVSGMPPVEADGYVWYSGTGPFGDGHGGLLPLPHDPYAGTDPTHGWFAARKGSNAYVTKVPARCPTDIDLGNLGAMLPAERLACFRSTTIEFEGTYGCPYCMPEVYGQFSPAWIADPNIVNLVTEAGTGLHGPGLGLRFPPAMTERPETGAIVRVRGHFEDQAADECQIALVPWDYRDLEPDAVAGTVAHLWCRQMFVVEDVDVLGMDASYDPNEPM